MTLTVYENLEQGSDEWLLARAGIVTASVVGQLITTRTCGAIEFLCPDCLADPGDACWSNPTKDGEIRPLKTLHPARADAARTANITELVVSDGDTARSLLATLAAERITGHVEQIYPSRAMERGTLDEPLARAHYTEHRWHVDEVGFMVKEFDGLRVGYSPDGLVADNGLIEIKSREQKIQLKTVLDDQPPAANMAQMQCGLFVSGREWCEYVSWSGGMPMWVHRVYPDPEWFAVIIKAVTYAEEAITDMVDRYTQATQGLPPTERVDHFAEIELQL